MTKPEPERSARHKWMVLSNTTLGMLAAAINGSILLISLPAVFRGIGLKALDPANINYLLWTIIGYMIATAVLVVAFGHLGDQFGRARMYNLGFAIFTGSVDRAQPLAGHGDFAAIYLIVVRIVQGIGGALIMANSTALLTDAFPAHERGFALGINVVAAIGGQFVGLLIGGLLADKDWRLVFWINVPFGLVGTIWAYSKLRDTPVRVSHKIDWGGNISFGDWPRRDPRGDHLWSCSPMAIRLWPGPVPRSSLLFAIGILSLIAFVFIERRVAKPMLDLRLFRIPGFAYGNLANLASGIARGGLQFMLIVWLQGIWLPLHGYSFEETPLWSAIFMLPLTIGLPAGRTGVRLFVGSPGRCAVRGRRHAHRLGKLYRFDGAAGRFFLHDVCRVPVSQWSWLWPLCGAERDADHELRPPRSSAARRQACGPRLPMSGKCYRSACSSA